jgi:hypothetical protein
MEIVDRYLQAVKFWLPRKQQDDMIAELSDDIRTQIDEHAATLGRPLNEIEVENLLRQRGSPILVANRYLPQESLIGPLLFPLYRFVLKIVTLCILIPTALGWLITLLSPAFGSGTVHHWATLIGQTWASLWTAWFAAMGVVTLVFAILERSHAKSQLLETWNPRKLPPLRPPHMIPRSSSAIELAVNLCILVWWTANMASPLGLHIGDWRISLAPVWSWFFWAILLLTLANVVIASVNLLRPYWTVPRIAVRSLTDLAGAAFFCWLLKANIVTAIAAPNFSPARAIADANFINQWLARMFPWAVAVCVIVAMGNLWRLVHLKKRSGTKPMRAATV